MSLNPINSNHSVNPHGVSSSENNVTNKSSDSRLSDELSNNSHKERKYEYKESFIESIKRLWGKLTGDVEDVEVKSDGTRVTTVINSDNEEYMVISQKPNGFTTIEERTFDKDYQLVKSVTKDSDNTVVEKFYNSQENVIKSKTVYADGKIVMKEFDDHGNLKNEVLAQK